jgi:hypothetical protein
MKKMMTAAAALLLGVALAATAQANGTMRHSAKPAQQTVQSGTTAAPQIAKKRMAAKRLASKRTASRRHLASKRTGKVMTAKLTRHHKTTQMARLHNRSQHGQQQTTGIGSSSMPNNSNLNSQSTAGSGSSIPQDQNLQNQNTSTDLQNQNTTR